MKQFLCVMLCLVQSVILPMHSSRLSPEEIIFVQQQNKQTHTITCPNYPSVDIPKSNLVEPQVQYNINVSQNDDINSRLKKNKEDRARFYRSHSKLLIGVLGVQCIALALMTVSIVISGITIIVKLSGSSGNLGNNNSTTNGTVNNFFN